MRKRINALLSDNLLRSSGLLFAAFMVSSVFNYLFQIVMGRLLGPGQYGLLNALLSLLAVLSVPVSTLLMVVSRKTSEYKANRADDMLGELFRTVNRKVLLAGIAGLFLFLLLSPVIAGYISAPSIVPVLLLGVAAFVSLGNPINTAFLQGLQNYGWLSAAMGIAGPARLAFSAVPVLAGFGVNGAVGGLVATGAFSWAVSWYPLRKYSFAAGSAGGQISHLSYAQVMPVFLANLAFTVMTQADIVLVNRYFSAHEAGIYASAAILGRAVMYIPGSIVLALFPMVSEAKALNRSGRGLLAKAMLATLAFSGGGALLFYLLPEWTLATFFGARYLDAAPLLKYFGLAMLPMAFLLVLMNYFVAREKNVFGYILLAGAAAEISAVYLWHSGLTQVIAAIFGAGVLALVAGLAAQAVPHRNLHRVNA